jgi:helix-turn-helix protein
MAPRKAIPEKPAPNPESKSPIISQLLTPTEVAAALHSTTGTLAVWRCTRRKALPFVRLGRKILYRSEDVQAFIATCVDPGDGPKPEKFARKGGAVMSAPQSFYQFLTTYVSSSPLGDPISDLGADLRYSATMEREEGVPACPPPPQSDADLYAYLKSFPLPDGLVDEAWLLYLRSRSC